MTLGDILNPWAALAEARSLAEQWRLRAASAFAHGADARRANRILQQQVEHLRRERDEARETCLEAMPMLEELATIKRKRPEAVARGNRKGKGMKRGQRPLPMLITNDTAGGFAPTLRTELTG